MRWGHKGTRPHTQYLWVSQACWIRVEVELDAISCSRQSEPSDQQYQQHHIGEGSCEVHHLTPETKISIHPLTCLHFTHCTETLGKNTACIEETLLCPLYLKVMTKYLVYLLVSH